MLNNLEATEAQLTKFKNQMDAWVAECFTQNLRNEIDERTVDSRSPTVEYTLANAIKIEKKSNAHNEIREDPNEKEIDTKKLKSVKFNSNSNNNSNNPDKLRNVTDKTNSAINTYKPNTSKFQNSQMRCHQY